ncbi:uncharacterized protein LOC126897924 [Daktulosphaira vitifoliae]|uniref:uncharacterized protein LOC126897924 n=1 Tax=Daktulosphaira vitifoliae TaxID=58002 RepID=UPI0021AA6D07|nr:uncharacterized protein LOC126897924 [Daktulosphaira vitifoliae]
MIDGASLKYDFVYLLKSIVCDMDNYFCMMSECSNCPNNYEYLKETISKELDDENIVFKQWVSTDRAELVTNIECTEDFIETLINKIIKLKKHHYIFKIQSNFLKLKKETLEFNECIILADFSENYNFAVQDEIQSFHWVNKQATLHPFVYYYKIENIIKCRCICIISDHMEHNTVAVHTFQNHLIQDIRLTVPFVKKIHYFSDGASSQYKNKKNFINLCYHIDDFGFDAEWHFFASCHGKNASDGVGGTTKREVSKSSLQRVGSNQILTPIDMFQFCDEKIKGIKYIYVPTIEVQQNEKNLNTRFKLCKTIIGTREKHRIVPINTNTIRSFKTSLNIVSS